MVLSVARFALAITLIAVTAPALGATDSAHSAAPATATKKPAKPPAKKEKPAKAAKKPVTAPKPTPKPAPASSPVPVPAPAAPPPAAVEKPPDVKQTVHFAALRAEKVNLRSGPSADFPIQWVYVRRGLPVEVVASFDIWRKIRDSEGTEGWVNQQMLTGRRSVLIAGSVRDLRHDPKPDGAVVAKLEAGVVATVSKCDPAWCEVKAGGYKGWLMREEVWGLEPGEVVE